MSRSGAEVRRKLRRRLKTRPNRRRRNQGSRMALILGKRLKERVNRRRRRLRKTMGLKYQTKIGTVGRRKRGLDRTLRIRRSNYPR